MQVSSNVFMMVLVIVGVAVFYFKRGTLLGKLSNGVGVVSQTFETESYSGNMSGRRFQGTQPMARYRLVQYGAGDTPTKTYDISRLYPNTDGLSIGRSSQCDITINDPKNYVGSIHAYLRWDDEGIILEDNDSTNGIYDESKNRVDVLPLDRAAGSIFYIANLKFRFETVDVFATGARKNQRQKESTKVYKR